MAEIGKDIAQAKELLEAQEVVAIPTETVYGLAGNALDEASILKIYQVKNRPFFDPLIAHTDTLDKVKGIVTGIPEAASRLAKVFWPGPLTMLLPKAAHVPDLLTSGLPRVAVRIPHHSLTLQLLSTLDFPLAAPSANPFGYVSPTTAQHVDDQLGDRIMYILDGGICGVGVESTIVGFEAEDIVIYRLGGTTIEAVEEAVQAPVKLHINQSSDPSAPGMLKSHYSPTPQVIILNSDKIDFKEDEAVISFDKSIAHRYAFVLSHSGDLAEAAKNIFRALRGFDKPFIKKIYVEMVPDTGLGLAINDRIRRASTKC